MDTIIQQLQWRRETMEYDGWCEPLDFACKGDKLQDLFMGMPTYIM